MERISLERLTLPPHVYVCGWMFGTRGGCRDGRTVHCHIDGVRYDIEALERFTEHSAAELAYAAECIEATF